MASTDALYIALSRELANMLQSKDATGTNEFDAIIGEHIRFMLEIRKEYGAAKPAQQKALPLPQALPQALPQPQHQLLPAQAQPQHQAQPRHQPQALPQHQLLPAQYQALPRHQALPQHQLLPAQYQALPQQPAQYQALPQQPALHATDIVIKTDKDETHTIHVLSTDTVRDVKLKIFTLTKIDVASQSIVARHTVTNTVVVMGRTVNTVDKLFLSYHIAHDNIRVHDRSVESSTPAKRVRTPMCASKRVRTPSRLIGGLNEGDF